MWFVLEVYSMSAEESRWVAEEFIARLKRGDIDGVVELYSNDQVVNMMGDTPVSGYHEGRETFWPFALGEVVGRLEAVDEAYVKENRLACLDGNVVVMLMHGGLPTKTGGRYDQNYGFVWTIRDGKICHTHELLDSDMIETAIYDRSHAMQRSRPKNPYRVDLANPATVRAGTREATTAVAKNFIAALQSADPVAYFKLLSDDVATNIVGWTPYSGRWIGHEALRAQLFDWHADHFQSGTRCMAQDYRLLCADDRAFCMLLTGGGVTGDGRRYDQHYGVVANIRDDLITDLHVFLDTAKAEEFIFGNPFVTPAHARAKAPFRLE